jgi:hypothetical protein
MVALPSTKAPNNTLASLRRALRTNSISKEEWRWAPAATTVSESYSGASRITIEQAAEVRTFAILKFRSATGISTRMSGRIMFVPWGGNVAPPR